MSPDEPRVRSFARLFADSVERHGDRPAVIDTVSGSRTTYDELATSVATAAARLLALGLSDGDRVAVLARNGLEQAVFILACARVDLVHVGLPVEDSVERMRTVVELAQVRVLLSQPALLAQAGALGVRTVLDSDTVLSAPDPASKSPALPPVPDDPARTYSLICTSGSTGRPKLVRLTGAMSDLAARAYTDLLGLGPTDRTAVHLPMWWVSGHVTQLASALHSGGAVVTMPAWSGAELVRVVAAHDVSWLDLVPTLWHGLLREEGFTAEHLSSLRVAVFGGAPASAQVLAAVRARLPDLALFDSFAMSEVPAPITCLRDTDAGTHPGTVGRAQPGVTLAVLDADGAAVSAGHVGAVAVRTPALTPGYASTDSLAVDAAGWFRTGDLGSLDDDGFLTITGRATDGIIRGGVTIHPLEIERALLASGLVSEALVVGFGARAHGEDIAAFVVPASDRGPSSSTPLTVAEVRAAVRERVGLHAVPVQVRFVAELPRNSNRKPDRAAARALLDYR